MSTVTLSRTPARPVALAWDAVRPLVVPGTSPESGTGPVVVAVDDDGNAGAVLRQAREMADGLGVALRAAYVWTDCRPPDCPHHQRCHRDLGEASEFLAGVLAEHLTIDELVQVERDVVHGADAADALAALSDGASLLVVGGSSHLPGPGGDLGDTTRGLIGRTRCPIAVVPYHRRSVTGGTRWRGSPAGDDPGGAGGCPAGRRVRE